MTAENDRTTVVGVFTERGPAERALEDLRNAGFREDEVGFIAPHRDTTETSAANPAPGVIMPANEDAVARDDAPVIPPATLAPGAVNLGGGPFPGSTPGGGYPLAAGAPAAPFGFTGLPRSSEEDEHLDDAAGRAVGGAVTGGVLGGVLGAAAALLIPGFGPAIAGGILAAALGGAAFGAVTGGVIASLTHIGVAEEDAQYYQDELAAGRTVLTVHTTPDRASEALAILRSNGGYDASTRPSRPNQPFTTAPAENSMTQEGHKDMLPPVAPTDTRTDIEDEDDATQPRTPAVTRDTPMRDYVTSTAQDDYPAEDSERPVVESKDDVTSLNETDQERAPHNHYPYQSPAER